LAAFHSFVNARYSDISIDRNDFDSGFLITFRKKSNFTLQKAMIFGQKITIIIITIIKHHNSKHYIYSIFIKTDNNRFWSSLKILLYNIPDVDETFSLGAL
jgi:hypothetical protein